MTRILIGLVHTETKLESSNKIYIATNGFACSRGSFCSKYLLSYGFTISGITKPRAQARVSALAQKD